MKSTQNQLTSFKHPVIIKYVYTSTEPVHLNTTYYYSNYYSYYYSIQGTAKNLCR